MKPRIHLICNAHIDPVWLWTWHEGAAEAVSTFRTAVDFCEKYNGLVFNHNEVLIYQWVEEFEPALFAKIQELVKKGVWHIMGGWYLQPDVQITGGESVIHQIETGRKYFEEKFGVRPTAAYSADAFGHSRGLVQILAKTGYESYHFSRTGPEHHTFRWLGFDGSSVIGHRIFRGYGTVRGAAPGKLRDFLHDFIDEPTDGKAPIDTGVVYWGIGDHGGGASIPDMEGINEIIRERDDIDIFHSTPETFDAEIRDKELPIEDTSIQHVMVGCYSSMVRTKQLNRRLENKIALCEKIASHAESEFGVKLDTEELDRIKRELMFCQFHDILPGTCIKDGEEDAHHRLGGGIASAEQLITKSFIKLCAGQVRAKDGEIPVVAYNPHPYPVSCDFDVEFNLASQNWNENEYTFAEVYDEKGNRIPSQTVTPECSMRLDWRKHVTFTATVQPFSVARFNCRLTLSQLKSLIAPLATNEENDDAFSVANAVGTVRINRSTGLIDSYVVNGKEYVKNAGRISVIRDNEDPWGMNVDRFEDEIGCMTLVSDEEANAFVGYPEEHYKNVRVVENGEVRTVIQALFRYENTRALVQYTIPKNQPYFDIRITLYSNDANRMYKYNLDTVFGKSEFIGQTIFGTQPLLHDGGEVVFHQWCSLREKDEQVVVLNNGTYAGSCKDNVMKLSLLRTPVYSAHPICERKLGEPERYRDHIDFGERRFDFRISAGSVSTSVTPDADALVFNQPSIVLSFFPCGEGEKPKSFANLDNKNILLSACRPLGDGRYMLRLFNSADSTQNAELTFKGHTFTLSFGKFEVKTFVYENDTLDETNMLMEKQ